MIKLVDREEAMTHPQFRVKLEAVGFGVRSDAEAPVAAGLLSVLLFPLVGLTIRRQSLVPEPMPS
jgi:hypothetical protein